jgi:hypothetical protein
MALTQSQLNTLGDAGLRYVVAQSSRVNGMRDALIFIRTSDGPTFKATITPYVLAIKTEATIQQGAVAPIRAAEDAQLAQTVLDADGVLAGI